MNTIVILGMHRSGTSLVAQILHNLGISMGKDLLAGDDLNPDGYFEDEHFLEVNKSILRDCGGGWADPPERRCIRQKSGKYERMLKRAISNRVAIAGNKDWGFKDPRTCLTAWFLHSYLINPKYVIVRRNRADVIASIKRGWSVDRDWEAVYDLYNLSMNDFVSETTATTIEITYEDLVDTTKYVGALRKLLRFVELNESNAVKAVDFIRFRRI